MAGLLLHGTHHRPAAGRDLRSDVERLRWTKGHSQRLPRPAPGKRQAADSRGHQDLRRHPEDSLALHHGGAAGGPEKDGPTRAFCPRRPVFFRSVAGYVVKGKSRNSNHQKQLQKAKKTPAFRLESGCFVELLPRFELGTSSLPTDWEDRVCCFQTLLHPLHSGVPSFPELLCPLSPSARFPVWVSVWVKGRREPAIAPPAQPDCYQSASPHRLRERLRTSPLSSNSVLRTPSAALALQ